MRLRKAARLVRGLLIAIAAMHSIARVPCRFSPSSEGAS